MAYLVRALAFPELESTVFARVECLARHMVAPIVFAGSDFVTGFISKMAMRARRLVDATGNLIKNLVGEFVLLGQLDAFCLQGDAKLLLFASYARPVMVMRPCGSAYWSGTTWSHAVTK